VVTSVFDKISQLPVQLHPVDGTELMEMVQGGVSVKVPVSGLLINSASFVMTVNQSSVFPQSRRLVAGANVTLTDGGPGNTLTIAAGGGNTFGDNWNWVTDPNNLSFISPLSLNTYANVSDDGVNVSYQMAVAGGYSLVAGSFIFNTIGLSNFGIDASENAALAANAISIAAATGNIDINAIASKDVNVTAGGIQLQYTSGEGFNISFGGGGPANVISLNELGDMSFIAGNTIDFSVPVNSFTVNGIEIGWKILPQNSQSGNYTTVRTDSGQHVYHPSGAGAGDTFTIAANASVAYPKGTAITFVNRDSNNLTIAITSDTLFWAQGGGTGSRTLAPFGVATALKVEATEWIISGTGLT
jgi:hypothetical protein